MDDVTLVTSPHESASWYLFDCLTCAHRVVKSASHSVALALASVDVTRWTVPAEVLERAQPGEQPPLEIDDLLDALIWLRSTQDLSGAPGPASDPVRTPSPGEAGSRRARPNAA